MSYTRRNSNNSSAPAQQMDMRYIPVDAIKLASYQKTLSKERVRAISQSFNLDRMRPIEVSWRDGTYWCFDGQHRLEVYRQRGDKQIPAIVHKGLTYQDEARLFAEQQNNVGQVTALAKWRALVEAKDKETLAIVDICRKNGFTIGLKSTKSATNINCVTSIQKCYRELGDYGLECVLSIVQGCWFRMPSSLKCDIIDGLTAIRRAYNSDLTKPSQINWQRLRKVLSKTTPEEVIRLSGKYRFGAYGRRDKSGLPVAKTIVGLYNHNLSTTSKSRVEDVFLL